MISSIVASDYPEDMFALQRAKQITANPLLMQPPRTRQRLPFKPLGPRKTSPRMTQEGMLGLGKSSCEKADYGKRRNQNGSEIVNL